MKYVYYSPSDAFVLDWLDTDAFNYAELPETVMPVTDEQWHLLHNEVCWVNLTTKELITNPPPGDYYRLDGDKWVYDADRYESVLQDAKSQIIQMIKTRRDVITADYIVIGDYHFHSDANSRIQQMSLTRMGQAKQIPKGLMWQTKNLGPLELTNEIAAQFESVTMDHDMRLFANAQRHIAAIEALEDTQAVQEYDYSTGWQP
ncbi:DUF4376 domain-containing protein [Salmonella enterica]|uniref:DUF4376 domain-containing protein n=1 Tax=Salmonella enterica TaxID=28901 RepID=UPI0021D4EC3E|nr:DUF4376 domain-containing protein [Salmonella enterica]MCU7119856.1 DUF4376 domain-containing protein [Salmonella enterica]